MEAYYRFLALGSHQRLSRDKVFVLHAFFNIRNHFIRNLHVEGRNIETTFTNKGKIPKKPFDLKNFTTASSQKLGSRFRSPATKGSMDTFQKILFHLLYVFGIEY